MNEAINQVFEATREDTKSSILQDKFRPQADGTISPLGHAIRQMFELTEYLLTAILGTKHVGDVTSIAAVLRGLLLKEDMLGHLRGKAKIGSLWQDAHRLKKKLEALKANLELLVQTLGKEHRMGQNRCSTCA